MSSLNSESTGTGKTVFQQLSNAGSNNAPSVQTSLIESATTANMQLNRAKALDVPDEMKGAQQMFLYAMQMRRDGIANIAANIQRALGNTTNKDAINAIAVDMARFYASDVIYKDYATHLATAALRGAGIAVGANGVQLDESQFLPDLSWLQPAYVASKLGTSLPSTGGGPIAPGTHGHSLDSVSVGGTTLADRLDQHTAGQPTADVHAQLHQRRPEQRGKRRLQGLDQLHEDQRPDDRSADDRRSEHHLPGPAQLLAAGRQLHGHGDDSACPGREERLEQHADIPSDVPVARRPSDADLPILSGVHDLTSTAGIVAIAAGAVAVVALVG